MARPLPASHCRAGPWPRPRPMSSRIIRSRRAVVAPGAAAARGATRRRPAARPCRRPCRAPSPDQGQSAWQSTTLAAAQPIGEPLRQAPARPAQDLDHVARGDRPRRARWRCAGRPGRPADPVRSRTSGRRAEATGTPGFDQGDMGREEQGVDPGEHGDRGRARRPRPASRCTTSTRVGGARPGRRGRRRARRRPAAGAAGPARMTLATRRLVVRQQPAAAVHHRRGTAVVDLERMVAGAGKQPVEVDQEPGIGAGVAVDDLVVVAHAEHVEAGRGQQAQQQHVGRGQVLKLVDQQVPARRPGPAPEGAVGEQRLDRPVDLLVEVDGPGLAQRGSVGRGTARPGRARRRATPPPRRGRPGRGGPGRAPRGRGRSGRCWPGAGGSGPAARSGGGPRARRAREAAAAGPGQEGVAEGVEGPRPGPEVRRSGPRAPPGPSCCRPRPGRPPAPSRGRRCRWRSRSVSTRVLPEPAGAMMRAGPLRWATAASWSAARSATGSTGCGGDGQTAQLDRLGWTTAGPVELRPGERGTGARRRSTPRARRGGTSPVPPRPPRPPQRRSTAPRRAALRAHHHTGVARARRGRRRCWPRPGNAGGPPSTRRPAASVHGSTSRTRGRRNGAGSTARATTTGRAAAQAAVQRLHDRAPARPARPRRSLVPTSAPPRPGTALARVDHDAPPERRRTGTTHARQATDRQ